MLRLGLGSAARCRHQRVAAVQEGIRFASAHSSLRSGGGAAARSTHYTWLRVPAAATADELKVAYRKRALECHPDMVEAAQKSAAESEFRRVSEAYAILSDDVQRVAYDRSIGVKSVAAAEGGRSSSPSAPGSSVASQRRQAATTGQTRAGSPSSRRTSPPRGERPASPSRATSPGRSPSPRRTRWTVGGRKGGMLRGEADKVFRDAFQGKTIHQIVFDARYAKKYGRDGKARTSGSHRPDGLAKSGLDVGRETADEAVQTMAEDIARLYERKYRYRDPKLVRVHLETNAGEPAPPPSSHMPFRPFVGTELPPGVTAESAPKPEPPVELKPDEDIRVEVDERTWRDIALAPGYGDDTLDSGAYAGWLNSERMDPHNQGVLRSFHRPV